VNRQRRSHSPSLAHPLTPSAEGGVLWITGRPASGKTTLARALVDELTSRGIWASMVDSDDLRAAITPEPRYTTEERALFYRALAYIAARLAQEGIVAVVAATAHDPEYRRWARELCPGYFLVYARCPLTVCEARDPKGLYRRARSDAATTLPGVGVPYQEPADADCIVDTDTPGPVPAQVQGIVDAFLGREQVAAGPPPSALRPLRSEAI
jgi:adenylylsulfate kinase